MASDVVPSRKVTEPIGIAVFPDGGADFGGEVDTGAGDRRCGRSAKGGVVATGGVIVTLTGARCGGGEVVVALLAGSNRVGCQRQVDDVEYTAEPVGSRLTVVSVVVPSRKVTEPVGIVVFPSGDVILASEGDAGTGDYSRCRGASAVVVVAGGTTATVTEPKFSVS